MKKLTVFLCAIVFVFGVVGMANADILSFNFQGNVTRVNDNEGYLNGSISDMDMFTGTLTYDTSAPDSKDHSLYGLYEFEAQPSGISVTINGLTFKTDTNNVAFQIYVGMLWPFGDELQIKSSSSDSFPVFPTNPYERIECFLYAAPGTLSSDALPTDIDLAAGTWFNYITIQSGESSTHTVPDYCIEGKITVINPVPISQPPIANAGFDQIVFDEVTLDGTESEDPDGTIDSYQWQLNHRENPAFDQTAQGENPTVSILEPGFYDVTLTVVDNAGLTDIDEMECAAIGRRGDLSLDGDIDGSDLADFAGEYGK